MGAGKDHIDLKGFFIILLLTLLWGLNYPAIKFSSASFSPIFTALLRSVIASALGIGYCLMIREPLFHRGAILFHGIVTGLLFGTEFLFLYLGMRFTDSARAVVFVYLSPFVVAAGAHLFLRERLNAFKIAGLLLAFLGICSAFYGTPKEYGLKMFLGDIFEVTAAILWAVTTLYIKRYLSERVEPIHTFLYQLVFSIPVLFIGALILEDVWVRDTGGLAVASLVYQSVIVAFASYLVWFQMIHTYPVGVLSAFTFLTPIFGVLAGIVLLNEELTTGLLLGLACVSAGIYCINYRRAP